MSKHLTVYDNGGKTLDRYTVVTPNGHVYSMSEVPSSPQGVFQYAGDIKDFPDGLEHCGQLIENYPSSLDVAICHRECDN